MSDYTSEDEVLGKAYDAKLMKRLLGYVKPYKHFVIFAILLSMWFRESLFLNFVGELIHHPGHVDRHAVDHAWFVLEFKRRLQ